MMTLAKFRLQAYDESAASFVEFLENEYPILRIYLGETAFTTLAVELTGNNTAEINNSRWLCQQLPTFLKSYKLFQHRLEIQELAVLELALTTAFSAPNFEPLNSDVKIHPSVQRLWFKQNSLSIWSALKCESTPPKPHMLDEQQEIIVWRQGHSGRFRILGHEEAAAFDAFSDGRNRQARNETLKSAKDVQNFELYLAGWREAEILAG